LAALTPDVILATASQTVAALQAVTQTVPIVFTCCRSGRRWLRGYRSFEIPL
jgi:ABC-type uncharacterized transport system substrate-binding protein